MWISISWISFFLSLFANGYEVIKHCDGSFVSTLQCEDTFIVTLCTSLKYSMAHVERKLRSLGAHIERIGE